MLRAHLPAEAVLDGELIVWEADRGVDPVRASRADVAVFVRVLTSRPSRHGVNVVSIDPGSGLANATLQRMLVGIPLTDDERAAVDNAHAAVDRLLQRLTNVATPAGPTPNQLYAEPGKPLPLIVLPPPSA